MCSPLSHVLTTEPGAHHRARCSPPSQVLTPEPCAHHRARCSPLSQVLTPSAWTLAHDLPTQPLSHSSSSRTETPPTLSYSHTNIPADMPASSSKDGPSFKDRWEGRVPSKESKACMGPHAYPLSHVLASPLSHVLTCPLSHVLTPPFEPCAHRPIRAMCSPSQGHVLPDKGLPRVG